MKEGAVAEFHIEGETFVIWHEPVRSAMDELMNGCFPPDSKVVGEAMIKNKRFVIIQAREDNAEKRCNDKSGFANILTKRELQIVMLVAEGKVNKQIAHHLQISEWTVSTHLRRIFAKLGVESRAAMVHKCSDFLGAA